MTALVTRLPPDNPRLSVQAAMDADGARFVRKGMRSWFWVYLRRVNEANADELLTAFIDQYTKRQPEAVVEQRRDGEADLFELLGRLPGTCRLTLHEAVGTMNC